MKTPYDFYNSLKIKNPYIEPHYNLEQILSSKAYKSYKALRIMLKNLFPLNKYEEYKFENKRLRKNSLTLPIPKGNNLKTGIEEDGNITLEFIDMFDVLPKENIYEFKSSLKKFISINKINIFGVYLSAEDEKRINDFEQFNDNYSFSHLCDVTLKTNNKASKYITSISFSICNLSNSFCMVMYRLHINEYSKNSLMELFKTQVSDEERISRSYGVKWYNVKKLSIAHYNSETYKSRLINNFIKEIKWVTSNELSKSFALFFHSKKYLLPSLNVYETNILPNKENLRFWYSLGMCRYADYSSEYDACLCWTNKYDSKYSDSLNYICSGKNEPMIIRIAEYDISLDLGAFMVASSFNILIKNTIVKYNRVISKCISKEKISVMKLLKLKSEIETNIFFEKRFLKEFSENTIENEHTNFKNQYSDLSHLQLNFQGIKDDISSTKSMMSNLLSIFDSAIEYKNSQQNFKLQWWMFLITILSLIVSLVALISSNDDSQAIINFINNSSIH